MTNDANAIHLYLLPGMGGDRRMYQFLALTGCEVHYLDWPDPGNCESLEAYAAKLATQIETDNNVLLGSSMGGMVALEMAKLIHPLQTILLSAPSGYKEFPWFLRLARNFRLHRLVPVSWALRRRKWINWILGLNREDTREVFYEMLATTSVRQLEFLINAILKWQCPLSDQPFIQMTGDRDKLFPPNRLRKSIRLTGCGHVSSLDAADQVSRLIQAEISLLKT